MREKAGLGRCVSVGKVLGLQAWRSESSPQYSHKKTCMEGPCSPSPGSVEIGGSLGFADCQPSSQFSVNPHDGGPQLCMCMHRCMYPHIHTHASTQMKKCWEWWRWLQTGTDKTGLSVQGQALMTIGRTVKTPWESVIYTIDRVNAIMHKPRPGNSLKAEDQAYLLKGL